MANDFTARVAGISVELGMSVQNKSGIWCKPTVRMYILQMREMCTLFIYMRWES